MTTTETVDVDRDFPELAAQLRALPTEAPERLRERVSALGDPAVGRPWRERLPTLPLRRTLLVLAPATVLFVLGIAAVVGIVSGSKSNREAATATVQAATSQSAGGGAVRKAPTAVHGAFAQPTVPNTFAPAATDAQTLASPTRRSAIVPPSTKRLQDYQAYMNVRVKDLDALSKRTADAMRLTRSYGGYVASVQYQSPAGQPGSAELVLRIPVGRVQVALERLSALGTVLSQQVTVRDLQRVADRQEQRIGDLRVLIARLTEQLGDPSLSAEARVRLQLQVEEARRELKGSTNAHGATLRQAALSRVSLELTTQKPVAAPKKHAAGRFERTARNALGFVAVAAAAALYLLIVLAPLAVLVALAVAAARAWRRREQERLLASA
jgi:hypothetical protein